LAKIHNSRTTIWTRLLWHLQAQSALTIPVRIDRRPPPIDQPPKESTIEWYERQKQANQPIVHSAKDDRKMNRIFYFCVGLAICFVVWKLKN
jgi:hypothetical protein